MRRVAALRFLAAVLLLVACAGRDPTAPGVTSGAQKAPPASTPTKASPEVAAAAPAAPTPAEAALLPDRIDAGTLPRAEVLAVLKEGAGRFLKRLRTEPHLERGRFVGWRLVSLFDERPTMRGEVLRPGDTLMRVNGQSIERPEEFLHVWQAMRTSGELVLLIRRAGHDSTVRYAIVE